MLAALYWPAGHEVRQAVEPSAENCPPLQLEQALDPDEAEYVPLKQLVQPLAEPTE